MFLSGFLYVTFLSIVLVSAYLFFRTCYRSIKETGFVKFLEKCFLIFVAVGLVYLVAYKVGETFLPHVNPYNKVIKNGWSDKV